MMGRMIAYRNLKTFAKSLDNTRNKISFILFNMLWIPKVGIMCIKRASPWFIFLKNIFIEFIGVTLVNTIT